VSPPFFSICVILFYPKVFKQFLKEEIGETAFAGLTSDMLDALGFSAATKAVLLRRRDLLELELLQKDPTSKATRSSAVDFAELKFDENNEDNRLGSGQFADVYYVREEEEQRITTDN
jgi:hypothetical protein